jgi:DNA primase
MSLDPVEEIKSRLDIVEFIRSYLPLQHAGSNFKARCPFHQEKSGSFMVSTTKQIWHCFGCGEGGDIFSFFMKQEGVEFGEALRILAERASVTLEQRDPRLAGERQRLMDALELASQYYHQALIRAPQAEKVREYVKTRGLDTTHIDEYRIGYALSDREALSKFLVSRKFTAQELIAAGLSIRKERGYELIDRFHDRLMIPIRNIHGSVVGFGGRTLDPSVAAKYINSPQTDLYDKSRIVFGLDKAKQEIRQKDFAVIVEGYMDVFAVYGSGMHNVVATSGTALTVEQVRLLKRYTQNLSFAFDTDTAGSQATVRGIELALAEGMNIRVILLPKENGVPKYKDPDECVRADVAVWNDAVLAARPFVEFYFDLLLPQDVNDPFEKKKIGRTILDILSKIPDAIEQDHWIKQLATRLHISEAILWEELRAITRPIIRKAVSGEENASVKITTVPETLLVALLLKYPKIYENCRTILPFELMDDSDNQALYKYLQDIYTTDEQEFLEHVRKTHPQISVDTLLLLADKDFGEIDDKTVETTALELARMVKSASLRKRMTAIQSRMREAENTQNTEAIEECLREFNRLQTL